MTDILLLSLIANAVLFAKLAQYIYKLCRLAQWVKAMGFEQNRTGNFR